MESIMERRPAIVCVSESYVRRDIDIKIYVIIVNINISAYLTLSMHTGPGARLWPLP
jgi:hypothetical protein